jgi:hypothetical protein
MFTVEFEPDASLVTTIDEQDMFFEVEMVISDDGSVLLTQFPDNGDNPQYIYMSYQQLLDITWSLRLTEGAYYLESRETRR